MDQFFSAFLFFGVFLSVGCYQIGLLCKRKWNVPVCNPLLIAIILNILILLATDISYETYFVSTGPLTFLLTPATVCLAIPLYQQIQLLKQHWGAILIGITAGVSASLLSIWAFSSLFHLSIAQYISLLPKSITTAIGLELSGEFGGIPAFTAAAIIVTGIFGKIIAEALCKFLRLKHPIARGLAIGCASHAIGTTKALEMGETEGAMSSLAIALSGILTTVLLPFFVNLPL